MKRSIVTYTGILGAAYAGILGLSQCLSSEALAAGEPLCYSTGPLENDFQQSDVVFVKVLNNNNKGVEAEIVVYALDGGKRVNFADEIQVGPKSSGFVVADVADKFEFEVQVELEGTIPGNVLLGAFGKKGENNNAELVAAHRVVHSEWTRIPCVDKNNI